jgi:hypothetical protein
MAQSSAFKRKLSGSTDGKAIKITTTGTAGDTIHTAVAGTTPGTFDEIWLWACNLHTGALFLTIEFGGTSAPDNNIVIEIPAKSGLIPVVPGLILQNGAVVKAFAGTANLIMLMGFVNTITD